MGRALVVDDEAGIRFLLREMLEARGHTVIEKADGVLAKELIDTDAFDDVDLVLTDYAMPGIDGLGVLAAARARRADVPVILLTARGSERLAVRAMKEGAFDYVPKPFDIEELEAIIARALETAALRNGARRRVVQDVLGKAFVGEAPAFREVVDRAIRFARRDVSVLVRGETGTGKELLASLLHAGSHRASGPLVRFNCAAIVESLAESELFGHAKGAFTGATSAHRGLFSRAAGGTIVLDEIGELPLRLQPKLLRVLQSGELTPVGASGSETVDVRVIASTHRDLRAEIAAGRFREDLFYRIAVVELEMPPLRARIDDIPLLTAHFARAAADRFGVDDLVIEPGLVDRLAERSYPGNVRELENLVTRLVAESDDGRLRAAALHESAAPRTAPRDTRTFREQMEQYERALLESALRESKGNQSEAARRLGLSRVTFLDRLKRAGLR